MSFGVDAKFLAYILLFGDTQSHKRLRRYYHMKQPRMISVISFPRNNSSISPEEVTYIESADASDIAPEKFIASILEDIMNKEIREEEAV